MVLAGRRREMAEIGRLLDGAADGRGGVLAITGPPGSGRTELAAAAAREGARRGFTVLRTAAIPGQPGALAWARLLADAGAPEDLAAGVLADAGPMAVDRAARALTNEDRRLLVIDDIDHGGAEAQRVLQMVAARASAASTAMVVTSVLPPGVGTQLRLTGLSEDELAEVLPNLAPQARHGVWLASGGLPGAARSLAEDLTASTDEADPLVHLALTAPSRTEFLDVDTGLIRLLELALPRAPDDGTKARLLGRLARELLRDALLPYRGRLAVFGGAAMCLGPVSLFLGLLATELGLLEEAVRSLEEATAFARQAGALPCQALCLEAAARALQLRQAPGDRGRASACRDRAQAIAGRLGMTGMLSQLAAAPAQWSLRRDGEDWLLQAGPERARLRDSRGLHYLRSLLAAPSSEIRALDLAAGGPGLAASDAGPLVDAAARDAYRQRIRELDDQLAAADRAGDGAAAENAHSERLALVGELRRAAGLAGRPRRAAADNERARVNVTRTLRAAIDRITRAAPVAGAHLSSSIRTGTVCRYQPAPGGPARWHT